MSRNHRDSVKDITDITDVEYSPGTIWCQHCGANTMQLGAPITHYVGDEYDRENKLGLRGNWIEIPSRCEQCNKLTSVIVAFHKGNVVVAAVPGDLPWNKYTEISREKSNWREDSR